MSVAKVGCVSEVPQGQAEPVHLCGAKRSRPLPGLVPWFGGKGTQAARLAELVPATRKYVEAYGGAASLLMRLEPRNVEVYNDLDGRLINLCRVLQDPEQSEALRRRLEVTFYSREEFRLAVRTLKRTDVDPVERAWAFYVAQNQCFSGIMRVTEGSWSLSRAPAATKMAPAVSRWWGRVAGLAAQIDRFGRVQIESRCALEVTRNHDSDETVHYLDPPYVHSTRVKGATKAYAHEQPDDHHRQLVELLPTLKGRVILSGYASELYRPLERQGWHRLDRVTVCPSGRVALNGTRPKRVESVWLNFDPPKVPGPFVRAGEAFGLAA